MTNKYSFDKTIFKKRLRALRENSNRTQKQVAEGIHIGNSKDSGSRTAVTTWESDSNEILPNFRTIIDLCNYFDVDIDYLLGKKDIKSEDTKTICETLHLAEKTVNILKSNSDFGHLIDSIVTDNSFYELVLRSKQLGYSLILKDVVVTSFSKEFEEFINKEFNNFYFSTFPIDLTKESYISYLKSCIPYENNLNIIEFIEKNFLEEGKKFLFNEYANFFYAGHNDQYNMIITTISEISFEYYLSLHMIELSKHKLNLMFSDILENTISQYTIDLKKAILSNFNRNKL